MTWYPIASVDDALQASPWLSAVAGGQHVVIARDGDRWFAVQDRCTHAGCPLVEEATIAAGTIHCHCHGSEFDLASGEVLEGPAEYPLRTFPVRVAGDQLEVEV
jgi:3-phenylpropionate/trans-cinnamate dioxygenase ferredoxin subunit